MSSRIIKKIAEDQIHQSVKQLVSAAEQGELDLEEKSPSKGSSSTKMARNKSLPSKFQKLLASKFNEGFQSVFTTTGTGRSGS